MPEEMVVCPSSTVLEHSIKLSTLAREQESHKAKLITHDTLFEGHVLRLHQLETSSVMHKREVDEVLKSMKSLKNAMWTLVVVAVGGVLGFIFEIIGRILP